MQPKNDQLTMINILFYTLLSLLLIIAQTSFLSVFSFSDYSFDLLIIVILSLSLLFSHPFIIIGVLLIGFCMDSVSGTPFGVYTSAYIWIYIFVQAMKRYVHYGNVIFVPLVSVFAVFIENSFLFFTFFVCDGASAITTSDLVLMGNQMLLAFFMLPLSILIIHFFHKQWESFLKKYVGK